MVEIDWKVNHESVRRLSEAGTIALIPDATAAWRLAASVRSVASKGRSLTGGLWP